MYRFVMLILLLSDKILFVYMVIVDICGKHAYLILKSCTSGNELRFSQLINAQILSPVIKLLGFFYSYFDGWFMELNATLNNISAISQRSF
jgi:hypothetical protein